MKAKTCSACRKPGTQQKRIGKDGLCKDCRDKAPAGDGEAASVPTKPRRAEATPAPADDLRERLAWLVQGNEAGWLSDGDLLNFVRAAVG